MRILEHMGTALLATVALGLAATLLAAVTGLVVAAPWTLPVDAQRTLVEAVTATLVSSFGATLTASAPALALATWLARSSPSGRVSRATRTALEAMQAMPPIVLGALFGLLLGARHGLVGAVVALAVVVVAPLTVAYADALATVPDALREASLALGATEVQTWRRVVLPRAWRALASSAVRALGRASAAAAPLLWVTSSNVARHGAAPLTVALWQADTAASRAHVAPGPHAAAMAATLVAMALATTWLAERLDRAR